MKVRIENDGQPAYFTHVTNAETGELLTNVFRFEVDVSKGTREPMAVLYTWMPVLEWTGEAEVKIICPCCKQEVPQPERDGPPDALSSFH